jgi:hypothetical protein
VRHHTDRRHKSRGGEDADPWDRDQAAGGVIGTCPLGKLVIECRDPLVKTPVPAENPIRHAQRANRR